MKHYGLIGYPLTHSLSESYFKDKFRKENITDCVYKLFPIKNIDRLPDLLLKNQMLFGFNVTIPFKESVMDYIDKFDEIASSVGAVNCVKVLQKGNEKKLSGFNTDVGGFENSLKKYLKGWHRHALVLGTGGGSKAVGFVLRKLGIEYTCVSRNPNGINTIGYGDLNRDLMQKHLLVVNTTPLGMYPETTSFPEIPYEHLGKRHLLFDLVYNPELTVFLRNGIKQGAFVRNGLEMLYFQAEKSWEIWEKLTDDPL